MKLISFLFGKIIDFLKNLFRNTPKENMKYTSSLNYKVWATAWSIPAQGLDSFPAFVPLLRPRDAIANTIRPFADTSGLSQVAWDYYYELVQEISVGRRVYYGHYWSDDGMNLFTDNINYYKNTKDGTTYGDQTSAITNEIVTGFGDENPLKFSSPWGLSSAADGKISLKNFLQKCISFNVIPDYYWDDTESLGTYTLGSNYNTYPYTFDNNGIPNAFPYPSYFGTPDPRRTQAIVNDYRFTSPAFANINNRTFAQEFVQKYKDITENPNSNPSYINLLLFYTAVETRQDFKLPWSTSFITQMYAFQSCIFTYNFGTLRKKVIHEPIGELGLTIKVLQTDLYPLNKDEARYAIDLNGHYDIKDPIPNYNNCMHNYGDITDDLIYNYGYVQNPIQDWQKYSLVVGGASIGSPAYCAFVKEIRKLRAMCRSNSTAYQTFTSIVSSPDENGEQRKLCLDTRYWYELMYHICLHGVNFFNAFVKENTSNGYQQIQTVLDEWKTISQNNTAIPVSNSSGSTTVILDRIILEEAATKGIMSGGYIPSINKWIWRLTAPANIKKYTLTDGGPTERDLDVNIEIPANATGIWIVRSLPGRPSYAPGTREATVIIDTPVIVVPAKPTIISRSPLAKSPFNSRLTITTANLVPNRLLDDEISKPRNNVADYSVPNDPKNRIFAAIGLGSHDPDASTQLWNSQIRTTIATYQGNRVNGPWGSPNTSTTRAYAWEYNPVNPDVSSPWHNIIYEQLIEPYKWGARSYHLNFPFGGSCCTFALTHEIWKRTFTSTNDTRICPARWKGFTQSIRALLEGNMTPEGKDPISEPCNVALYLASNRGYYNYISKSTNLWQSLGSSNEERDINYYQYLDAWIDDLISIKGRTQNSGKLYLLFDVMVGSATPDTLPIFRNQSTYKSDALELSDWYMFRKLRSNGIPCFVEARTLKTITDSATNITYTNPFAFVPSVCGYYWWLFTNPTVNTTANWSSPADIKTAFIIEDANFPLAVTEFDPYKPRLTSKYNNKIRTLSWTDSNQPGIANYNTPHYSVWSFYGLSDNYRYFYNKATNSNTFKGVKLDTDAFYAIDITKYTKLMTLEVNAPNIDGLMNYYRIDSSLVSARPLLNTTAWDAANPISTYGGTNGLWSVEGKTYWDTNVRKSSFNELITFVDDFSRNNAPESSDWSGVTYGFDPVAMNTIFYV